MHMNIVMMTPLPRHTLEVGEVIAAAIRLSTGLTVAYLVYLMARRVPWPTPFRARFALLHVILAPLAALTWYALSTGIESVMPGSMSDLVGGSRIEEMMFIGCIFYAIVVGISHSVEGSKRAARAEAAAAESHLAALRAQLQPHFLFNALHTVVQLIPTDPNRAMEAAELVAGLLRTTMEEQRDVIPLRDEWAFVSRYLEMEKIRFGDRLRVRSEIDPDLLDASVPSFALQTLVENAVRHGAAPRVVPTDVVITATGTKKEVKLTVRNETDGASAGVGTGLNRLNERLIALYGNATRLTHGHNNGAYEAMLILPRESAE